MVISTLFFIQSFYANCFWSLKFAIYIVTLKHSCLLISISWNTSDKVCCIFSGHFESSCLMPPIRNHRRNLTKNEKTGETKTKIWETDFVSKHWKRVKVSQVYWRLAQVLIQPFQMHTCTCNKNSIIDCRLAYWWKSLED